MLKFYVQEFTCLTSAKRFFFYYFLGISSDGMAVVNISRELIEMESENINCHNNIQKVINNATTLPARDRDKVLMSSILCKMNVSRAIAELRREMENLLNETVINNELCEKHLPS